MKKIILIVIVLLTTTLTIYAQDEYLVKGNSYLNSQQFDKAEQTFREAILSDSENLIYQCQLGLTLIQAKKYVDGQKVLDKILEVDSKNVAAIWYSGVGFYSNELYKKGILKFEEALVLIDPNSPQFYSAYWFIAASYSNLLKTEGLTYKQTDRMFECFEEYLNLQPDAPDVAEIKEYVASKKKRRPPSNVKVWIDL